MRLCGKHLIAAALLVISAASCTDPSVREDFVRASDRDSLGRYCFRLDLRDSSHSTALYLYTMIDASERRIGQMPEYMPLEISVLSPSGKRFSETAALPMGVFDSQSSFSRQYEFLYRDGFHVSEPGEWMLYIRIQDENLFTGLRGIGLKQVRDRNKPQV